jgi:hypothetical protein
MTIPFRIRLATVLTGFAALVAAYWIVELYPLYTHTGPAPGAGAQYVFVLIPSAALAGIASLAAVALLVPLMIRDRSTRSAGRWTIAGFAVISAGVFATFWVHVALRNLGG